MSFGILIDGSQTQSGDPEWVTRFDPDVHAPGVPYPTGDGACSLDPRQALRFATIDDAFAFWRQRSTVTPTRPDGRPNRPLTVFMVTFPEVPEVDRG